MNPKTPPEEHDELVRADDAIIGQAVRWSLAVLLAVLVVLGGTILWLKRKPSQPLPQVTRIAAPLAPARSQADIPVAKVTDITQESGITFVHNNGAYGEKLLPETMGGGVASFDFDNDDKPDLLFINSTYWPWHIPPGKPPTTAALYHNDGTGHFTDVTAGSGLDVSFYGMGVAVGDYDNDGNVDVFITAVGGNHLFRNLGNGKFEDVTAKTNVSGSPSGWSSGAAFIDYDNDGKLDLFVCNYVSWNRENDLAQDFKLLGVGRAYGPPLAFAGTYPYLYHNNGDGTFTDVSAEAGVQVKNVATSNPMAKSLGICPIDIDRDGLIDI